MSIYQQEFEAAVLLTHFHKLELPIVQLAPSRQWLDEPGKRKLLVALQVFLGEFGPNDLNARCLTVHRQMAPVIREILGCPVFYTLGWIDDGTANGLYRRFDDEFIAKTLRERHLANTMDVHAWLTLPSLEIIDLTIGTTYAVNNGTTDGLGVLMLGQANSFPPMTYKPKLVGTDFLIKAGVDL